jgi:D-alanyl-D-alanine carboxypeptidase
MLKTLSILAACAAVVTISASSLVQRAEAGSPPSSLSVKSDPFAEVIAKAAEPATTEGHCTIAPGYEQAAQRNADSVDHLSWSPFGRSERGWAIYQLHVAHEIGADCTPDTPGFAAAMARWQTAHNMAGAGEATPQTLMFMKTAWQTARPYVALRASGVCPDAPADALLTTLSSDEGYSGKIVQLRTPVAQAYRAMVAAARNDLPELAADGEMLRIFSGYRSPAYDAARCARDHNCGGAERATCSVHRTAEAFDLVVGHAPGFPVDSSADANRLAMTRTPAYGWLVANASRFGFINYSFEPWHWEFVGTPAANEPLQQAANS